MARTRRVLSFMSEWGGNNHNHNHNHLHRRNESSASASAASPRASPAPPSPSAKPFDQSTYSVSSTVYDHPDQPASPARPSSRPMSMIQTYQPPIMEVGQDTLPELQRIFTFLNSHSNKLYQEGYFLKFHDTDTRGRPAPDRAWQECFAQLVGTILSLWDASELDNVRPDTEVLPTFINLTDAAIHMMPSMTLGDGKRLENILSVSTAASNKYLFHFNSFNSLTQWTAGIRLAMFEHASLQEAYTGALIAGKGRTLNGIRTLLDRQCAKYEDWVRVRFGAGTPWRRCWCVVTPPDEKEFAKLQKAQKKKGPYDRTPVVLKGDIRFYDTQKVKKKTRPIATVKEAYSCYAIYPQSKQLIDQSTLVKVEAKITIHSNPETTTEGFVFIMPEARPAVSGFEIMLQFLFPVFDTFNLYGRPNKLIADVLDTRGLMFAMPSDRRYGYLEMWDVVTLIHTEGSDKWSERQWRKQMKDMTSTRMATTSRDRSRGASRRNTVSRTSLVPSRSSTLRFEENGSVRSQPATRQTSPTRNNEFDPQVPRRTDSAPPNSAFPPMRHQRSVSEQVHGYNKYQPDKPSRLGQGARFETGANPPPPPPHGPLNGPSPPQDGSETSDNEPPSPEHEARDLPHVHQQATAPPQGPVASPPTFAHAPSQRPPVQPRHAANMKPHAHMDSATLHQMADATNAPIPPGIAAAGATAAWRSQESLGRNGEASRHHLSANQWNNSNEQNASRSAHSGSRLPTIPASPYVEHEQFVESPATYQPSAPPVPEHAEAPQGVDKPPRPDGGGKQQIQRKPVPGRSSTSLRGDDTRSLHSTTSSSLGSLRNDIVDPEALDRLNYAEAALGRQYSKSSSRYSNDDGLSTTTPDYASIEEEPEPPKPARRMPDRPRSGMLKFVGDPDLNPKADIVIGDTHYRPNAKPAEISAEIPSIDFGPTYSLDPTTKRPGTSGTMTQTLHDAGFSRSRDNMTALANEDKRLSLAGRTTPIAAMHMRSSSASPQLPDDGRSIAWQPGLATQPQSGKVKLDPEEWVAQRATSGGPLTPPTFTHGRSKSHTPPLTRQQSGDWSQLQRTPEGAPARPPSRPISRPLSRGAERLLDQRPTSLSAREQEQVARMTNTPLIDLTQNSKKEQKPTATGLTAYIDQREKEKSAAKAKRATNAMQFEADRRMLAAQQRQMMELQQMGQHAAVTPGGYGAPSVMTAPSMMNAPSVIGAPSMIGTPGMMGTPPGYPQAFAFSSPGQLQQMYQPQQGYFVQPGDSPGMQQGWAAPSPQMHMPGQFPQTPMQNPYFMQQHQPVTQPYGASFDQAQAAARYAVQQGQSRRQ